jgi:branched-chain amino acid transport system permease protein
MASYIAFTLTICGIYGLLALSLNLIWGSAGMVNLGLAGFFGLGAYASALMTTKSALPIGAGWGIAVLVGALAGVVITLATTRVRDDYLAIVTLGFAEVVRLVASNEIWLTGGTNGISGAPGPYKAALGQNFNGAYLGIVVAVVLMAWWLLARLDDSPAGRVLRAIREDAIVAAVAGKRVLRFRVKAFALSAAIAALAGALYAHFISFIAPDLLQPLITIYVFLAVAAGGVGRPSGALAGAVLLVAFLEATRFLVEQVPAVSAVQRAALREILIGLALLIVLRWRPGGLFPERLRTGTPGR